MNREVVVTVRAPRTVVLNALRQLPMTARSSARAAKVLLVRCGLAALWNIRKAFVTKARGGVDEAGEFWKPLSPKTIAYSRKHPGLPKKSARAAKAPSYALSTRQRQRWWQVYGKAKGRYSRQGASESEAAAHAAAVAWTVLKQEGATTLLAKYGQEPVDILRDTGRLLNSITPAIQPDAAGASAPKVALQVFQVNPGEVIVGTKREWAYTHHHGVPGHIPQRRLWPAPSKWPQRWNDDLLVQAREGLIDLVLWLFRRGRS